jgi:hypothetical protein
MTTKLFLDTEFTGLHQYTTLVSLALVADSGEEFYAESAWYDETQINPWLAEHVLANRLLYPEVVSGQKLRNVIYPGRLGNASEMMKVTNSYGNKSRIVNGIDTGCHSYYGDPGLFLVYLREWLAKFEAVEIWGDVLAYDYVLFCQIFDGALNIPKNIFYIPFDLATLFKVVGIDPDVNREEFAGTNGWTDTLPKHNALHDARVQHQCYKVCQELIVVKANKAMLL